MKSLSIGVRTNELASFRSPWLFNSWYLINSSDVWACLLIGFKTVLGAVSFFGNVDTYRG